MASTRDVIAPPIFAEDASTTIPATPIAGQSYRDPVAGPASSPDGWPYAQLVNSAEFNQLMFQWSSLLSIMDLKGILGWSDLKNYTERAITFGSDGNLYVWIQESGPGTSPGVKDPISEPEYWQSLSDYVGANDAVNAPIATVAAAGTINLTTGAPDTSQIAISGTGVSINGFTVAANRFFIVKMTGASNTLVNSASLVTGRGANIPVAAGDCFLMRSTAANTVEIVGGTFLIDRAIGSGQALQSFLIPSQRTFGVSYPNTSGRTKTVSIAVQGSNASDVIRFTVGGVVRYEGDPGVGTPSTSTYLYSEVANGESVLLTAVSGTVAITSWVERG